MALRTAKHKSPAHQMPSREQLEQALTAAQDELVDALKQKAEGGNVLALDHRIRKLRRDIHNLKVDLKNQIYRETHETAAARDARLAKQSLSKESE